MINHEFIAGRSRTDFLQYTLQINTDSLQGDNLIAVVNYLIDHVHVIYDKYPEMGEDVMWPIEFKLSDGLIFNESVFWKLIFCNLSNAYQYLHLYIHKLCELANVVEFQVLLQSSEYQFHGGLAFNEYWLWCSEGPLTEIPETVKSINIYAHWISRNDLGFEVNQDDCINLICNRFGLLDNLASATLLAQRLNDGQHTDKGFDFLRELIVRYGNKQPSLLKLAIEQLLNDDIYRDISNADESVILELCAVMYGSNERCTNEVMDYARSLANKELWKVAEFQMKKINYLRQVGDVYWQQVTSQNRYIDTSFHLFDTHTKKWIDYSERVD